MDRYGQVVGLIKGWRKETDLYVIVYLYSLDTSSKGLLIKISSTAINLQN